MDIVLPKPGTYIVAVSGGVDSMALLHMLYSEAVSNSRPWKLIVAHLDHGIREDSAEDRRLVQAAAGRYGLPFVYHKSHLGAGTSEAEARKARYEFLHKVRGASGARAIITAHHQDDVLETAIINLLRSSGRKGLTSLKSHHDIERPLLQVPKRELIAYAKDQGLVWHEDSTNQNLDYLRNYIRHRLLPKFDKTARDKLHAIIAAQHQTNNELDTLLVNQLHLQSVGGRLDRIWFNHLPHAVAREVMAEWLRAHGVRNFDRKTLERLVVAAKVSPKGSRYNVLQDRFMQVNSSDLALVRAER
ncbi:MAG TPA: tRNA lysidine(34) synthetase TilS [Verrucomicrobiae bacterium]|nr:tRNA lysidine(34) synthetase TilS [Verrucomicrobiae bacterium]